MLRQENDARLNTLQELEKLRTKQKQMDSSVKKIKRDLEEINKNVAEKEVNEGPSVDTVHNNTTEKWKQEVSMLSVCVWQDRYNISQK